MSVSDIFEYINDKLLIEHYDYLTDLTEVFFKVFDFKVKYKNEIFIVESLYTKYLELINDFRNKEEYFYINMCSESDSYDEEFFDSISNLLVR